MSTQYDPASWAANRYEAGWALLGTVWSSVFATCGALAATDDNDALASAFGVMAGLAGLAALLALTTIGCRLAFTREPRAIVASPVEAARPAPSTVPGTPSVRIIETPTRRRSDAAVMVGLAVGIVLAVIVVGLVIVAARG